MMMLLEIIHYHLKILIFRLILLLNSYAHLNRIYALVLFLINLCCQKQYLFVFLKSNIYLSLFFSKSFKAVPSTPFIKEYDLLFPYSLASSTASSITTFGGFFLSMISSYTLNFRIAKSIFEIFSIGYLEAYLLIIFSNSVLFSRIFFNTTSSSLIKDL